MRAAPLSWVCSSVNAGPLVSRRLGTRREKPENFDAAFGCWSPGHDDSEREVNVKVKIQPQPFLFVSVRVSVGVSVLSVCVSSLYVSLLFMCLFSFWSLGPHSSLVSLRLWDVAGSYG